MQKIFVYLQNDEDKKVDIRDIYIEEQDIYIYKQKEYYILWSVKYYLIMIIFNPSSHSESC